MGENKNVLSDGKKQQSERHSASEVPSRHPRTEWNLWWVGFFEIDRYKLSSSLEALFSLTHSVLISPDESKTFFLELKNNIKIYIIAHLRTEKNTTNHICSFKKHTHTHTLTKRHTDGASVPTGLGEVFIAVKKKKKSWEIVWVEQAESGSPGSGRCVILILYKSQVLW